MGAFRRRTATGSSTRAAAALTGLPRSAEARAPTAAFAVLLEQGRYLGSVSTLYQALRADGQVRQRRRQARHKPWQRPKLVATGPGQVYS